MNMDAIISALLANGIPGLMLAFFIYYVTKKDSAHESERKEWKETSDEHVQRFTDVVEKNTTALIKMEETLKAAKCNFK